MDSSPVITISGDTDLVNPVLRRTLQTKFRSLQKDSYSKDEVAFASFCDGFEFTNFQTFHKSRTDPSYIQLIHKLPCLHTFWTECPEDSTYITVVKPRIDEWIKDATDINDDDKLLIVFCVTPEVRSKRSRITRMRGKHDSCEDLIIKDYKEKCSIVNLRLASADPTRISNSFASFAVEVNRLALNNFLSSIAATDNELKTKVIKNIDSEQKHAIICRKLSLSVAYEMIRDPLQSSHRYSKTHEDLEYAMTQKYDTTPSWLTKLKEIDIHKWDYPRLIDTKSSWKYLPLILSNNAHIIQIWTFLFVRRIHTLCGCGLVQEVYRCCVQTLHCTARLINTLKLPFPPGVFNSWAYMSCLECVESMMVKIDPEILAMTASTSLILVRAELWHYAWEKLRAIGLLCHLMPGSHSPPQPNETIIDQICSGITLPYEHEVAAENQGIRLVEVLKSKEKFKNAFMSLGEMVIGAFKHAGRRRMAFSIGTRMADFHKEVGMVKEAEQLLCDVTSLHSVQHWPQLSSSAYSILAHCQRKLKQEDKEVNSLLVLVTTPKHSNSTHDPARYIDQLMYIADRAKYQKLLSWEPLFQLESISFEKNEYHKGDVISVRLRFDYKGPKTINITSVSVLLEPDNESLPVAMTTDDKSENCIDHEEMLNEIMLEPGPIEEELKASRPIGGDRGSKLHKVYYSSTNISDIDGIQKRSNTRLILSNITLCPGSNICTISGKILSPGTFQIHQVVIKAGALDFCLVVPTAITEHNILNILPDSVDINISLIHKTDIILTGVPVLCQLKIQAGKETLIEKGAELTVLAPPTAELETVNQGLSVDPHRLQIALPHVSANGSCDVQFDFFVSSQLGLDMPVAIDHHGNRDSLLSWRCELEVYCNWLTPTHVARLPLTVYEPLTFTHKEHSAGESTFLQIVIVNSCPLPLLLKNHALKTTLQLKSLTGSLPKIFYPGDVFSFIWQHSRTNTDTHILFITDSIFSIDYSINDDTAPSRTVKYNFSLSNLETLYNLKVSVEPLFPLHPLTVNQPVFIIYTIINVMKDFRDSTYQPQFERFFYTIKFDSTHWSITSSKSGTVDVPHIAQNVRFKITGSPKTAGYLAPPTCSLVLQRYVRSDGDHSESTHQKVLLTDAQCYNVNQHQLVQILPASST